MENDVRTEFIGAESLLYEVKHRPWMPPDAPWIMTQTWNDLAFFHYAVEPKIMRALVPEALTLDLYDGNAWISVVPFGLSNLRPPGIPSLPVVSRFPEVNVRTYVTYADKKVGHKPGVYFFSLDAGNLSAVWAARLFYRLPYWHAEMNIELVGKREAPQVRYRSRRIHGPKAVNGPAELSVSYGPAGEVQTSRRKSLEEFLAERYCLYAVSKSRLYRSEVHHLQWPLQPCDYEFEKNSLPEPLGLRLPSSPDLAHFSRTLKVLLWPPHRLK